MLFLCRTVSNHSKSLEKFNEAMVIYLENLNYLNEHLSNSALSLANKVNGEFNFKLTGDTINNFSIRFDPNYPDNWAHCMKYLLTILKQYIFIAVKKEDAEYNLILEKASIISSKQ